MYKVITSTLLLLAVSIFLAKSMLVRPEDELIMKDALYGLITTARDSNGQRFLVPAIIRLCFHDCVVQCDGCIDSRRRVQGGNNGLELTWRMLRTMHQRQFSHICSRADFFALACVVTADFAGERGEQEGLCMNPTDGIGNPILPNRCRPNMQVLWGRRTCEVAQLVEPLRNIPDANQDPYEWFQENMQMTPRETVCIMGSHALGKLRANETGFEGDYTTRFDVLSNEYYQTMVDGRTVWEQEKSFLVVDDVPETRHQWNEFVTNTSRVNSDMFLTHNLGDLNRVGRSTCVIPPRRTNQFNKHCPRQPYYHIVEEMARDNLVFIDCFGRAMDKMIHTGYQVGELVPTGVEIPPPPRSSAAPPATAAPAPRLVPAGRRLAGRRNRGRDRRRRRQRGGRRRGRTQETQGQVQGQSQNRRQGVAGLLSLVT
ncbi:putative ascorbate peroxidase [Watersipora subatra]|uniref:putative ascorbate peroxidase n=1 Tax=Watersipora subatra TaxID=2589382 RepID=UPI00355B4619